MVLRRTVLALVPLLAACGAVDASGHEQQAGSGASGSVSHGSERADSGGAEDTGVSSHSAVSADAGTARDSDASLVGEVLITTAHEPPDWYDSLTYQLQPAPLSSDFCGGATSVGPCCYFPPPVPPPTLLGGGGSGADAGVTIAGSLTLTDVTSSVGVGTFTYSDFGMSELPMNFTGEPWQPGDALRVSETGGQMGTFSITAPTLIPPSVTLSAVLSRTESVTLTWTPDPNADTFSISFDDGSGAGVACSSPDAAGTVTIDASLLAQLPSGRCQSTATRAMVRYAESSNGKVRLQSFGYANLPDTMLE